MEQIFKQGKVLFAVAVAAIGIENLICADVPQPVFARYHLIIPVIPFVPAIQFLAYLAGAALLVAGLQKT